MTTFTPTPSLEPSARAAVTVDPSAPPSATALAVPVARSGSVPAELGLDRERLAALGFEGRVGSTLVPPAT